MWALVDLDIMSGSSGREREKPSLFARAVQRLDRSAPPKRDQASNSALIDTQRVRFILSRMFRLILSCLLALSFLGSAPAIAAMATQPPAVQASDCTMTGDMPDQSADHSRMACCTSDCTMAGTAGLPQLAAAGVAELEPVSAPLALSPVRKLDSLHWATVDPPPKA